MFLRVWPSTNVECVDLEMGETAVRRVATTARLISSRRRGAQMPKQGSGHSLMMVVRRFPETGRCANAHFVALDDKMCAFVIARVATMRVFLSRVFPAVPVEPIMESALALRVNWISSNKQALDG